MRYFGTDATPQAPGIPDSVCSVNCSSNAQSQDYPSGTHLVRVTFSSTIGGNLAGVFNGNSTGAAWGTSASGTGGSTTANVLVGSDGRLFQRSAASTGFSVVMSSNGICTLEFWSRSATTG